MLLVSLIILANYQNIKDVEQDTNLYTEYEKLYHKLIGGFTVVLDLSYMIISYLSYWLFLTLKIGFHGFQTEPNWYAAWFGLQSDQKNFQTEETDSRKLKTEKPKNRTDSRP